MTTIADIKAITPTANAKAVIAAKGHSADSLLAQAQVHASELKVIVTQLTNLHPAGGGDAANLTALNNLLTSLV
jgi:hypothetical protein